MAPKNIWRIAALVASIVLCMALALGACMSKPADVNNPRPGSPHTATKGGGTTSQMGRSERLGGAPVDAGARPGPAKPQPKDPKATPKSNTGMLRQMHLQGGE